MPRPRRAAPGPSAPSPPRPVRYSVAASLDGFMAGPQGEFDWIPMDPEIDFGALMARYDTLIMGRRSWEAAQAMGGGGMPGVTSYVVSRTLDPAQVTGATLARDPAALVADLQGRPGKAIWMFGGGALCRSMLEAGLVDDLEVAVIPIVLGGGLPLVAPGATRVPLALTSHRVYPTTGTVLLTYRVERP